MAEIKTSLSLEDNFSAQIKKAIDRTDTFADSVAKAKKQMEGLCSREFKVKGNTVKKLTQTKRAMESMRRDIIITIAAKDVASSSISRIGGHLKSFASETFKPTIKIKDEASKVLKDIKQKLTSIRNATKSIINMDVGKKLYGWTIGSASSNEQQLFNMQSIMNSKTKGSEMMGFAYKEAQNNSLKSSDTINAVGQLASNGLDAKKYLEPLMNLSVSHKNASTEDIAHDFSLVKNGQMGEALDGLKKLGINNGLKKLGINKSDLEKSGMKFNDKNEITNMKGDQALNSVMNIINSKYGNSTKDYSNTAQGLINRGQNSIGSMGRSLAGINDKGETIKGGLFDNFKKQLQAIDPLLEKIQKSKAFAELQKEIGNIATVGGNKLQAFLKSFDNPAKVKQYGNTIKTMAGDIKAVGTVGIQYIKNVSTILMPLIKTAAAHPKLFAGLFVGLQAGKGAFNIVSTFNKIKKEFPILNTAAKMFGKNFGNAMKTVGTIFGSVGRNIIGFAKLIPGVLNTVIGTVKLWVGVIGNLLKSRLISTIKIVASRIISIIRSVFLFIQANPIVLVITVIIGACVLLYEAWKHNFGGIRDKTHEVIEFVKTKIESVRETFESVKKHVSDFVADIKKLWGGLRDFFAHPIKGTINLWKKLTGSGTEKGNALGTSYFEGGSTWIAENGPEIVELPSGSKVYNNRQTTNILKGMNAQVPKAQGMSMVPKSMGAYAPTINTSKIANQMKSLKTQSVKWGKDVPGSFGTGINNNMKPITDSVTTMATKIKELIHFSSPDKGPLSDFDTYPVDMMKTFGSGIKDNTKLVTNPTTNMSTHVKGVYSNLNTASLSYGSQTMQEFGSGIQASAGNVVAIVKALTDKVIEQFKTGFGIHSPSKVMFQMGGHLMQGLINGMSSKDVKSFIQNWIGSIMSAAGGTVTGWLTAAIALTGAPMSWLPALQMIAMGESGGDPMSINLWDINAQEGHPSKGLMQLIDENMEEFHLPGMTDIWNPIENAAAAIRLIEHDYGNPWNTPGVRSEMSGGAYKGYAVGLTRVPYDNFPAMLHEDERVLTANEARNYNKKADGASVIIQKLADKIEVRDDSDIDKIATALAKKLKSVAFNM
ncbi:transglycosylase SLT domain-containing protein [Clostridium sp. AWRP]|uniref:transglycosylase SLT domain-containing protein n=1 Tax=Clostridium sp. AWRP TaxID=2212991 RepID=UPI000FD8F4D7|nr:transglycosylase SLT domain-containing protein [Clostridium sp. AWRP]AZV57923.1 hypothetical protein DMR38_15650 [Clostridium sp. AWRP]